MTAAGSTVVLVSGPLIPLGYLISVLVAAGLLVSGVVEASLPVIGLMVCGWLGGVFFTLTVQRNSLPAARA